MCMYSILLLLFRSAFSRYLDDELILGIDDSSLDKLTGAMIPVVSILLFPTTLYCIHAHMIAYEGAHVPYIEHGHISSMGHARAVSVAQLWCLLALLRLHQPRQYALHVFCPTSFLNTFGPKHSISISL